MSVDFIDSNVVLYLLSADAAKADRAEALLAAGPHCSVQVLNEVANVCRRKLAMDWDEMGEVLATVKALCKVHPLTVATHERGLALARRYGLSVYDGMIVASACEAGCETLWSEDMHHGLLVEGKLRIHNPFLPRRVQDATMEDGNT